MIAVPSSLIISWHLKLSCCFGSKQQPWTNVSASDTPNQIVAVTLAMKKWQEGNNRLLQVSSLPSIVTARCKSPFVWPL